MKYHLKIWHRLCIYKYISLYTFCQDIICTFLFQVGIIPANILGQKEKQILLTGHRLTTKRGETHCPPAYVPPLKGAGMPSTSLHVAGQNDAERPRIILRAYANMDGTTTRAAYRFMLYAMRGIFDRTAARSPRHDTPPRRGRVLKVCRACARDGKERKQHARLAPRG